MERMARLKKAFLHFPFSFSSFSVLGVGGGVLACAMKKKGTLEKGYIACIFWGRTRIIRAVSPEMTSFFPLKGFPASDVQGPSDESEVDINRGHQSR